MSAHMIQDSPSAWVRRFASLVPEGPVLDLASGGGRHARLFASLGHPVLAVDRNPEALAACTSDRICTQLFDLEREHAELDPAWPLRPDRYAGVVVTNYLHRPLLPALMLSIAANGTLIYETFADGNGQFGKPSNPDFLLMPGELLALAARFPEFRVLAFEEGYIDHPKPAMVQRICARRASAVLKPEDCAL